MRTRSPILNWFIASLILLAAAGGVLYTAFTGRLPDLTCRQNQTDLYLPLHNQSPLNQEIQPAADNLAALTLYPQTAPDNPYSIILRIYDPEGPAAPLSVVLRPLSAIRNGKLNFQFKPLPAGRIYQVTITTDAPPETLFLAASANDRYPSGSLITAEEQSLPNDLTFNTYYRPTFAAWLDLLAQSLPVILRWLTWTSFITLIGFAVHLAIRPTNAAAASFSLLVLQSAGLGLAFLISIGYTQSVLNIPISSRSLLVWGIILFVAVLLRQFLNQKKSTRSAIPVPSQEDAALLFLFLFVCASRAIQTIGLEPVPLWVDGFNHYTKISLLAQDGILPLNINYPYGYHLLTYFAHLLTGLDLPAAAFTTGFWISALAIPAAWPLARRLFPQRWAAFLAVLLYGFFTPFPAYLATWSRFPFLLGLTLLPLALHAALDWLESPPMTLRREALHAFPSAILAAALVLSHYGTIIHYAAFLPVFLLAWRFWPEEETHLPLHHQVLRMAGIAAPAVAILLVKISSLMSSSQWKTALTAHQIDNQVIDLNYSLNLTTMHGGWLIWGLALIGLLIAIIWKDRRKITFLAVGGLLALSLLNILQIALLGTSVSSWMNYIIALSLPLSWLAASALAGAAAVLGSLLPNRNPPTWLPAVLLACVGLAGFTGISGIINPVTILFTDYDRVAMDWIASQTPQDAVFYIDSFQWGNSITPSNGGGWIPALTGRGAVHPYIPEQREALQDFLTQRHVNYIYTESPQPLAGIPLFLNAELVFQNELVTIYSLPVAP